MWWSQPLYQGGTHHPTPFFFKGGRFYSSPYLRGGREGLLHRCFLSTRQCGVEGAGVGIAGGLGDGHQLFEALDFLVGDAQVGPLVELNA